MTKMRLGVIDYIDSAHYLPGHGKCGRVHGHTYKIEVLVEGEVRENGMVIDDDNVESVGIVHACSSIRR